MNWRWIKYRGKFADGPDEWEYLLVFETEDEFIRERLNEIESYEWSEHWRGWEFEFIELPPYEHLVKEHDRYQRKAASATAMATLMANLINDYPADQ